MKTFLKSVAALVLLFSILAVAAIYAGLANNKRECEREMRELIAQRGPILDAKDLWEMSLVYEKYGYHDAAHAKWQQAMRLDPDIGKVDLSPLIDRLEK